MSLHAGSNVPPGNSVGSSQIPNGSILLEDLDPTIDIGPTIHSVCQGRPTLVSGNHKPNTDQVAKTRVYFTNYGGNLIGLQDGSGDWQVVEFVEPYVDPTGLTTGRGCDVFGYLSGGTLALEFLEWSSGSARATAVELVDGVWLKVGDHTRRLLFGFESTGATTTEDSDQNRLLSAVDHPVKRMLSKLEFTNSWGYTVATIRSANGDATNQVKVFQVLPDRHVELELKVVAHSSTGNLASAGVGVDTDAAITSSGAGYVQNVLLGFDGGASQAFMCGSSLRGQVGLGSHFYRWVEQAAASGTTTWYGDNGNSSFYRHGIVGSVEI